MTEGTPQSIADAYRIINTPPTAEERQGFLARLMQAPQPDPPRRASARRS
jgi:hypothetical protein